MDDLAHCFDQSGFGVRFTRGRRGAVEAGLRGDVVVVVDVLRFSTVAAVAAAHGVTVLPAADPAAAATLAERRGAIDAAVRWPGTARLSPGHYATLPPGSTVVIASPNGAACAALAVNAGARLVSAGALVNASAAARRVARSAIAMRVNVTVVAAGELWRTPGADPREGWHRPALEDDLGGGAILAALERIAREARAETLLSPSPEARVAATAFRAARRQIAELLSDCASGRELAARGFADDVHFAALCDTLDAPAILHEA